jgi:hypothetical protein
MLGAPNPDFSAADWKQLSAVERAAKCRECAGEATRLARAAGPDMQHAYKEIAAQWHRLAAEIEDVARAFP